MRHRFSILHSFHLAVRSLLPPKFPPFPPKRFGAKSNFDPTYLRVRCVALSRYFQAILDCPRVRQTKSFLALFLPGEEIRPRVAEVEEEEEEEEVKEEGGCGCEV